MPISCRFYKHKYPEIEDVVMVNVRSIAEMGAYVNLLEYNNIEGMILLSELSRRRIRSINKLIRVGRNECVVVIRVDKDKGLFVFLSYNFDVFQVARFFLLNCRDFLFRSKWCMRTVVIIIHVCPGIYTVSDKCRLQTSIVVVYIVLPLPLLRANHQQANQNAI